MNTDEEWWADVKPVVPDWACPSITSGRRFENMTYSQMYNEVQRLHVANGGVHLAVHSRPSQNTQGGVDELPISVEFYCPHSRDHGDQCGRKTPSNPSAPRATRETEEKRIYYNEEHPCKFRFVVRRSKDSPIPQVEQTPQGHKNYMKSVTKCNWFIDGLNFQTQEGRRRNIPVLSHTGHPRRTLPIGKITDEIRKYIEEQAKINVAVPSISMGIMEKFGCVITDSSLYHAVTGSIGSSYVIDSLGNQRFVKRNFANKTEAFLHVLRTSNDISYVVLVENLDTSTEDHIAYETWKRDFVIEGDDLPSEYLIDTNFEGEKLLKPKKKKKADLQEQEINGRLYDTSRIITMGNERKFFIGVLWVQSDELRMFEAYPEVLVIDAKAKTNDLKHAFMAGVGVDAFWLNSTLFRSWIPNQTDTAYAWMSTIAIPAVIPVNILQSVQSVFTDDDQVFSNAFEMLLEEGECFCNAEAYICTYHIVRNFHQDFGRGCTTTHRKSGGRINWNHPWQKHCEQAIYKLSQCETDDEMHECKKWIDNYLKTTKDIARSATRRSVRLFFNKKFKKKRHWILRYRMKRKTLNLNSTSRIEGEFSGSHGVKMTSGTKMHKGYHKLRFLSDRRRLRKVRLCEDAVGKVSKKKSLVMTEAEWKYIDKLLTPYYCCRVESQCARALHENIKFQLTSKSDDLVTVAMWYDHTALTTEDDALADDDDIEDGGNELEDSDAESGAAAPSAPVFSSDSDDGGDSSDSDEGQTLGPGSHRVISSESEAISDCESAGEDDFTPFRYRRIRKITLSLKEDNFVMKCDCGYLERTDVPCRHILRLLKEILGHWGFNGQRWHMRLLKKLYYDVLTTLRAIRGAHKQVAQVVVSAANVRIWLEGKEATEIGVPAQGVLDVDGTDKSGNGDHGCYDDSTEMFESGQAKKSRGKKIKGRSEDECYQKFQTIMYACKKHPDKRASFYDSMCEWHEAEGRSRVLSAAGAPESLRTRGPADKPRGSSNSSNKRQRKGGKGGEKSGEAVKGHKRKKSRSEKDAAGHKHNGYEGDAAIRKIRKFGAIEGWIVETYPKAGLEHERWFMEVMDGSTYVSLEGDTMIKKLRWMEEGSVTKVAMGYAPKSLDTEMVKAYGKAEFFKI